MYWEVKATKNAAARSSKIEPALLCFDNLKINETTKNTNVATINEKVNILVII